MGCYAICDYCLYDGRWFVGFWSWRMLEQPSGYKHLMEVSGRDILTKNGKLTKEDFAKRSLVHEAVVDVEDLNDRCPEISELLMEQE